MKVYLETMGCQMNRLDSELLSGLLVTAGHEMTADRDAAEVILYNTCSVRRHAEEKVRSRLGADTQRKKHRPIIVGVLGCMAQRLGDELRSQHGVVDIVCGPGRLSGLAQMIASAAAGTATVALDADRTGPHDSESADDLDRLDLSRDPSLTPSSSQAFVRVMRGCDKFCTYCIVPFVRGPERSRPPDTIIDELRRLVDAGRAEVTLLGQTVNSYRFSSGGQTVRFSDLLSRASGVAGLRRLRFVTSHPLDFGDDILQAMADGENICPYIHVPAQSGSDTVLKRMGRRYTRADYDELVDRARAIVPGVVLAGDFIVGFPGETEPDHQASAELIRRSGYKNSFIFKYSPREGTAAAKRLDDDVPTDVKKRRNNELLGVQVQVGQAHHEQYVGQTVEALVQGPSPRANKQPTAPADGCIQLVGRTRGDHIVIFDGPGSLAGQYVDIQIARANSLTLFGQPS